jgi:branched-chain amino acid transport system ATP-binding protein
MHTPEKGSSMLEVKNLSAFYGPLKALDNVSFKILDDEIVAFIGPNGSGKSTAAKAIFGLVDKIDGDIVFKDHDIKGISPNELVNRGISLVPDGKRIFSSLNVLDNLVLGGYLLKKGREKQIDKILDLFPQMGEKLHQRAGTLSGGEQQMLAIGKALMLNPALLILDEPSLGLSPNYINTIYEKIREINNQGTAVLIIEQNIENALEYAHRVYLFRLGKIVFEGPSKSLLDPEIRKSLLR